MRWRSEILSSSRRKLKRRAPSANTSRRSETTGLLEQNWNEQSAATSVRERSERGVVEVRSEQESRNRLANRNAVMITRRNFFTKAAVAAAGTAVVRSLVQSARADEPVDSRPQDPAKSTGYDQGDKAMQFPPGEPGKD